MFSKHYKALLRSVTKHSWPILGKVYSIMVSTWDAYRQVSWDSCETSWGLWLAEFCSFLWILWLLIYPEALWCELRQTNLAFPTWISWERFTVLGPRLRRLVRTLLILNISESHTQLVWSICALHQPRRSHTGVRAKQQSSQGVTSKVSLLILLFSSH